MDRHTLTAAMLNPPRNKFLEGIKKVVGYYDKSTILLSMFHYFIGYM